MFLKIIFLTLILLTFQSSAAPDFRGEILEEVAFDGEKSGEEVGDEVEDLALNHLSKTPALNDFSVAIKINDDDSSLKFFLTVPTSPPNA